MGGFNDLAGKNKTDENIPEPVFSEIEIGDLLQDTKTLSYTLGQFSDNGK